MLAFEVDGPTRSLLGKVTSSPHTFGLIKRRIVFIWLRVGALTRGRSPSTLRMCSWMVARWPAVAMDAADRHLVDMKVHSASKRSLSTPSRKKHKRLRHRSSGCGTNTPQGWQAAAPNRIKKQHHA